MTVKPRSKPKQQQQRTTKGSVPAAAPAKRKAAAPKRAASVTTATPKKPRASGRIPTVRSDELAPAKTGTVYAYGPFARVFAANLLRSDANVIVCDGNHAAEALATAVALRREGKPFFVAPLLSDNTSIIAQRAAALIFRQGYQPDDMRQAFDAMATGSFRVDNMGLDEYYLYPPDLLRTLRDLTALADGIIVRSNVERERIEKLFGLSKSAVAIIPGFDHLIPDVVADADADQLVVWAPGRTAESLALFLYALNVMKHPALIICDDQAETGPHRFVRPEYAAAALARAAVVIDTNADDASTALALAGRGFGVVTMLSSGAHEFVNGAATYRPENFSSLRRAVNQARAGRTTAKREYTNDAGRLDDILDAVRPAAPRVHPSISIVIAQAEQPLHLMRILHGLAQQSYRNFEAVVVAEGNDETGAIIAKFPFARLVPVARSTSFAARANAGLRDGRGDLLGLLQDDCILYPDHFERLITAMVGANLEVGYSNIISRYRYRMATGQTATIGYAVHHDSDHDAEAALWDGCLTHINGYLATRGAWERIGLLNESRAFAATSEAILRFSQLFDFAHVFTVTGETLHNGQESDVVNLRRTHDYLAILSEYRPPQSQLIGQRLNQAWQNLTSPQVQEFYARPALTLANPLVDEG